jgi:hypothetical protein
LKLDKAMNQSTKILLIVFALLGSGAAWYLTRSDTGKSTVQGWEGDFSIENVDEIHRIFVADRLGNTANLERNGDHWIYNDEYVANQIVVDNMLQVFKNVQILYTPPAAAIETMVDVLATQGIKVETYDREGNKIKHYYIGGSTPDERGTFMILDGAEKPYVTTMPNFSGTFWIRFVPQGDKWRDKTVFGYEVEEIASVSVEYPKLRNKSFVLTRTEEEFEVRPYFGTTPEISGAPSQGVAEGYLTGFASLIAENYINDSPSRANVEGTVPFVSITVTTIDDEQKNIQLWPMDNIDNYGRIKDTTTERYYCLDDRGDFLLVQHRVFSKILWAYDYFWE